MKYNIIALYKRFKWVIILFSDIYGGFVGLVITQAIRLVGGIQWGMKQTAVLESHMTSVERVLDYINCPQEATFESPPGNRTVIFFIDIILKKNKKRMTYVY